MVCLEMEGERTLGDFWLSYQACLSITFTHKEIPCLVSVLDAAT